MVANGIPDNLAESFLNHIGVIIEINKEGLARIPSEGPLIVVANHPFGVIEGFILNAVICYVRRDYKFLGAYKLSRIPGIGQFQRRSVETKAQAHNQSCGMARRVQVGAARRSLPGVPGGSSVAI